jgi:NEDD4-binding protein 2
MEEAERRVLVLMRGVSGSGKSTVANKITGSKGVILSTDDLFMKDGRYEFDPKRIGANHAINQSRAETAMRDGISPVVIDNTNTQGWEMKPYVTLADKYGYSVEIVEPGHAQFPEVDFDEIMRRQSLRSSENKSLPAEVVKRMMDRFERGLTVDDVRNLKRY